MHAPEPNKTASASARTPQEESEPKQEPEHRAAPRRVALITGASGAIGAAVAQRLAARGDVVWLGYHANSSRAEQLAARLGANALPLNLLDRAAARPAVEHILQQHGRLDILVHSAGIARDKLLLQTSESDFDDSLDLHVSALYRLLQACLPAMRAHQYGRIVALTSYAALHGRSGQSAYSASKAALIGLVQAAALEEIAHGITINAVAPSVTASAMTDRLSAAEQARLLRQIPLGRMQTPDEAGDLVDWLTREQAATVSGQVLTADNRIASWQRG